jgi:hypothetical protein
VPQAPCRPICGSPSPEAKRPSEKSPESVTSSHVRCSAEQSHASHISASVEVHHGTRSSAKRSSHRSQQGSMGPAGYPLTPVQSVGVPLAERSTDNPAACSLTPGLHEVTPLHPQTSRTSAPSSAFCAKAVLHNIVDSITGAWQIFAFLMLRQGLRTPRLHVMTLPARLGGRATHSMRKRGSLNRKSGSGTSHPTDVSVELETESSGLEPQQPRHTWQPIPPVAPVVVGATDALCSHALSLNTSALSTTTATGTFDGTSWQSFAGFSDNTFPESSATLEPLGDPAGGSTFASFAGHSFFSMMGDTAPSAEIPASPSAAAPSQVSQATSSSTPLTKNLTLASKTHRVSPLQAASGNSCNHANVQGGSASSSRCTTPEPRPEVQSSAQVAQLQIQPGVSNHSSGSSSSQAVPSPSALTVAEKIKRHEAAYVKVKESLTVGHDGPTSGPSKPRNHRKPAPLMLGRHTHLLLCFDSWEVQHMAFVCTH